VEEQASVVQNLFCLKSKALNTLARQLSQIGLDLAESAKLPSKWILWPYI